MPSLFYGLFYSLVLVKNQSLMSLTHLASIVLWTVEGWK